MSSYDQESATKMDDYGCVPLYPYDVQNEMLRLVNKNRIKAEKNPWGNWEEMTKIKSKETRGRLTIFDY